MMADEQCARKSRSIFGLEVAALEKDEAVKILEQDLRLAKPVKLAFINANLANMAYVDPALKQMLNSFLLLNDGSGVNLASKILYGEAFPGNLNGTDFTPYFLDNCKFPLRLFLLGAKEEVSARVAEIFSRRWPQHTVAGYQHGYFDKSRPDLVLRKIRESKPHLVLVAMGNGLQEQWVESVVPECALSAWGIGALFDFLCGDVRRAPVWMRKLGIEWIYRLLQEPGRMWRRYILGNPRFIWRIAREWIALKGKGATGSR